jgi:bla regulator protein blaR1
MIFPALSESNWMTAVANHLWQSTVFALAAWLLAFALRHNQARTRFWLWLAASVKFVAPFSVLIAVGEWLHPKASAAAATPGFFAVMGDVTQPLADHTGALHEAAAGATFPANAPVIQTQAHVLPIILLGIWLIGVSVLLSRWALRWWSLRKVVRAATPVNIDCPLRVRSTRQHLEPGIFGIVRPILLLPEGIRERLSAEQLDAVIAHEVAHASRRDNLTAAVHMLVEAVFWFFPLVWWIGARLLEERERACDEAVLESRGEPLSYAEGILRVCKSYVEAPLQCVSGVTGSDLKKRITRIIASPVIRKLDLSRKVLLAMAAICLVTVPVAVGVMHAAAPQSQAAAQQTGIAGTWQGTLHAPNGQQLRIVAKVSGTAPNDLKAVMYSIDQGGQPIPATSVSFEDGTFKFGVQLIAGSYAGKMSSDGNSISGTWTQGPINLALVLERATPETEWTIPAPPPKIPAMAANANPSFEVATIKPSKPGRPGKAFTLRGTDVLTINTSLMDLITVAYNVQQSQVAGGPKWMSTDKYDLDGKPDTPGTPSVDQMKMMIQKLLADRFQLKFHRETKKMSAYVLTVAKNGPKMEKGDPNALPGLGFMQLGNMFVRNATMDEFAQVMQSNVLDRPVVNDTGLQGTWNFFLKWTPDESQFQGMGIRVPPPSDAADAPPPLFTAIQEQIGLKFEAGKAPVPVLVIEHAEPPSPN